MRYLTLAEEGIGDPALSDEDGNAEAIRERSEGPNEPQDEVE